MRMDRFVGLIARIGRLGTLCVLLVGSSGCQQSPATVSGSVTLDGMPLAISPDSRGTIAFQPVSGQGSTATGLLDSSGHFRLATGSSLEIAPGKYQVAISVVQLLPKSEGTEQGAKSITPAKYGSGGTSGLQVDVLPTANEFKFDMFSGADQAVETTEPATSHADSADGAPAPTPNDK
jgi:hypothetical protein